MSQNLQLVPFAFNSIQAILSTPEITNFPNFVIQIGIPSKYDSAGLSNKNLTWYLKHSKILK